jgi:ribosomal protein S18 acetylase RimI-like enzyme
MSIRLRPMREDEFPAFLELSRVGYAEDLVRNGGMQADAAQRKVEADFLQLLPHGYASDVELRVVEDEFGSAIGRMVYAEREEHGLRYVFLYDIAIDEAHRGRGFGREAMELLEAEVRERGLDQLQLNVFGGNEQARGLYRSLGFQELSVQMGKELA